METIYKVFENNHIGPPWAHLLVFGLDAAALLLIVFCVLEIRKAKRAAEDARRAGNPSAALFEGARFVVGRVELALGEPSAIRVTVTQTGTEKRVKNGHTHRWEEIDRQTSARPFYLHHESGVRIRVEPPEDVMLVDELDQREWLSRSERRLRADLAPGEHAVVEGFLRRGDDPEAAGTNIGYRQAASRGWIMKPGRHGKMHVSAEDFSRRHVLRARAFRYALGWMIVAALGGQCLLATYHARAFFGRNVEAEYSGKTSYQTRDSKGRTNDHYIVKAYSPRAAGGKNYIAAEVDLSDYRDLPSAAQGKIWVRDVPMYEDATALGLGSSIHGWMWFFGALVVTLGGLGVRAKHRYRRWYEGKVIEEKSGELPEPTGQRFLDDEQPKKKKKKRRSGDLST